MMTSPLSFAVCNTYTPRQHYAPSVFKVLERVIPSRSGAGLSNEDRHRKADPRLGRPGMEQWKILVLGVLRLGLNSDYDRIHELANHHDTIRQMLGHGGWEDKTTYNRQTIKDNLRLFTPEILDEINQLVVKAGHGLVKKNAPKDGPTRISTEKKIELHDSSKALRARCDSFVVETNVHYPTDINLLFDAVRKTVEECARLSQSCQLEGWRQYRFNLRQFKKQYRLIQKLRLSTSKVEQIKRVREEKRRKAYLKYVLIRWVSTASPDKPGTFGKTGALLQIATLAGSTWAMQKNS